MALTDNLISYWSLDEASGTRVDSHGGKNLTDNNTVGSTTGKIGNAARFIGANSEYLSSADSAFLNQGVFSVAFWFYYPSLVSALSFLEGYNSGNPNFPGWAISAPGGTPLGKVRLVYSGSSVTTTTDMNIGAWNFVAATVNTSTFSAALYLNGATRTGSLLTGTSTELRMGFTRGSADIDIDECAFWNRVLSSGEVSELYNSGAGRDYNYITGGGGGDLVLKRRKMYHHLTQMGA